VACFLVLIRGVLRSRCFLGEHCDRSVPASSEREGNIVLWELLFLSGSHLAPLFRVGCLHI
uniref:Uncharacterized protein n=1 Tax=Aegilops tauschii subsp. strangulata TaxID=200361 RepID=A0A453F141_AEGTS